MNNKEYYCKDPAFDEKTRDAVLDKIKYETVLKYATDMYSQYISIEGVCISDDYECEIGNFLDKENKQ